MHEGGRGVVKNQTKAVKWYRKAAEAGSDKAYRKLAEMGVDPTP
jgi:TPR repeat protein